MKKSEFISDLSHLLTEYKLDSITGFNSVTLSRVIFNLLMELYDFPTKEVNK